jgi:hypothetical protein
LLNSFPSWNKLGGLHYWYFDKVQVQRPIRKPVVAQSALPLSISLQIAGVYCPRWNSNREIDQKVGILFDVLTRYQVPHYGGSKQYQYHGLMPIVVSPLCFRPCNEPHHIFLQIAKQAGSIV